jgi:CheY-like chemotaxis protein
MRVAARREPLVEQPTLAGYSILVVEDEPFIARCLQMVLEAAGAEVQRAGSVREALDVAGQPRLSGAVLDCKHGIRADHAIARRLADRGLPFLLYGARELKRYEAWPNAPVVGKLASGAEIIATLRGLLQPKQSSEFAVVGVAALGASESL